MSKFTFSRQLFKQHPNKRHYNEVINDFKSVVNGGKITSENLRDESISFRHLKGPTSILLYKDCADDIFRFGNGSTSHLLALIGQTAYGVYKTGETDSLNTAKLWYTPEDPEGGVKIADFTIEYYPYNAGPRTKIAPCFQRVGSEGWVVMDQFEKRCGIVAGQSAIHDVTPYKPTKDRYPVHPVLSRLSSTNNSTGRPRTDKLHTGAIPQCVRLNIQIGSIRIRRHCNQHRRYTSLGHGYKT